MRFKIKMHTSTVAPPIQIQPIRIMIALGNSANYVDSESCNILSVD